MSQDKIRCPGMCITKDPKGNLVKGYLEEVDQETPTGRLFCKTLGCPFAFRDEHNKDQWMEGADLLKIPLEDPVI